MITKELIGKKILAVVDVMLKLASVEPEKAKLEDSFEDIGLDSLDVIEVVMAVEEHFNIHIPDKEAQELVTVQDLVNLTEKILNNNT